MKRTIPAKTYYKCDFCKMDSDVTDFKMECVVKLEGHCLDNLGNRACKMDTSYDLCDNCALSVATDLYKGAAGRAVKAAFTKL